MQSKNQKPEKNGSRKLAVSNLARVDPRSPQPFENGQAFSFVNQSAYIPFLSSEDRYAQNLLEARLLSPTHNACITTKKDYCAGIGFHDVNKKEFTPEMVEWFKAMNNNNHSATKINKKAFEDKFTFGNCVIELVRFTVGNKKKLHVYVHSLLEWRLGKPNKNDQVEYAIQSKLFLKNQFITSDVIKQGKKIPIYNPMKRDKENWFQDKGMERTIIWYKNEVSGFLYYGIPSAAAGVIYEILEYKSARYNLDGFDNNMAPAAILALRGNLGQTEADTIGKKILREHVGDGKRGRTVVIASEKGIDGSEFHKLDTKTDGSYANSDEGWSQKIILVNQWDAVLAGIVTASTLGKGSGFVTKILEHKLNTVIKPEQRDIMDEVWSYIFQIAQEWMGLPFDQYEIAIKNDVDISGLTDVDITPAVQINEVRQAKGLPEDTAKKGEYMKSTTNTGNSNNPQT